MYPNRSLTPYQQSDRRRSVGWDYPVHLPTASSPVPEVVRPRAFTSSDQLEGPSFFEQLLFNREQVYRDITRPTVSSREKLFEADGRLSLTHRALSLYSKQTSQGPPLALTLPEQVLKEEDDSMARAKQPARQKPATPAARATRAKSKATTAKAATANKKITLKPAASRKRPASAQARGDERAAKVMKTEDTPEDVLAVGRTKSARASAFSRGNLASPITTDDSDDGALEAGDEKAGSIEKMSSEANRQGHLPKGDSGEGNSFNLASHHRDAHQKPDVELIIDDSDVEVQKELELKHQREMEETISKMLLERQERDLGHEKEISDLRRQIQLEKDRSDMMSQEVDGLRRELEASHSRSEQHAALIEEHETLQEVNRVEKEEHEAIMKSLKARHTDSLAQTEASIKQIETLQRENSELMKQVGVLKAKSSHQSLLSPEPSLSQFTSSSVSTPPPTSSEARKLDNIRRTYTKVKRRYDSLHSVCVKLSTCTQSWDLSSFGEFGQLLRHLRQALDEDRVERTTAGQAQNNTNARGNSRG